MLDNSLTMAEGNLVQTSGYTVVELLATLAISAILGCLSIGAAKNLISKAKLKTQVQLIEKAVTNAQSMSVSSGRKLFIELSSDNISTRFSDNNQIATKTIRLNKQNLLEFKSPSKDKLSFYPNSRVSPGRIVILSKNKRCEIIISIFGAVRRTCD